MPERPVPHAAAGETPAAAAGGPARPPALPGWLRVIAPGYPSAACVVTTTAPRVLFDTGFGSDLDRTTGLLEAAGAPAGTLDLIANTHWHSDHVGGNAGLQARHGVPVAAAAADAAAVNDRDPDACRAAWLDQPVEPYRVDVPLRAGDRLRAGPAEWEVVPTPGHTPVHIGFLCRAHGVLIAGDAVHAGDVGWLDIAADGVAAIDRALATVAALERLPVRVMISGHGPPIADPAAALAAARRRYAGMRADPSRAVGHACRRILAFALMIHGPMTPAGVDEYLRGRPWLAGAAGALGRPPEALAADLVAGMRASGALRERDGLLECATPARTPPAGWPCGPGMPRDWPPPG